MKKLNTISKIFIVLSFVLAGLIALILAFSLGAGIVRYIDGGGAKASDSIRKIVNQLADLPKLILFASIDLFGEVSSKPFRLLISQEKAVRDNWLHKFPAPEDDGYLLLPGLSKEENQSIIKLIRISDGQIIAKWTPDWRHIQDNLIPHRFGPIQNPKLSLAMHPLLLNDGSLIFNIGIALIRLPICSSKPTWILSYPYHHSIELSHMGESIWVPSVTDFFGNSNQFIKENVRDDSLAEISLDGKVIQNISFSKILSNNNMTAHILGTSGFNINYDPIHINQITPAVSDSPYWAKGDLLISARHTSTIYLYRPSTGQILWYRQGPWLNQHSVHFLNDRAIVVFGNDVYGSAMPNQFVYKESHNNIYLYDFKINQTESLHQEAMMKLKPSTVTQGRVRVLGDMSIFIEETNNARLLKLDPKGNLMWSYINTYDNNYLGRISWSRYITPKELEQNVILHNLRCSQN